MSQRRQGNNFSPAGSPPISASQSSASRDDAAQLYAMMLSNRQPAARQQPPTPGINETQAYQRYLTASMSDMGRSSYAPVDATATAEPSFNAAEISSQLTDIDYDAEWFDEEITDTIPKNLVFWLKYLVNFAQPSHYKAYEENLKNFWSALYHDQDLPENYRTVSLMLLAPMLRYWSKDRSEKISAWLEAWAAEHPLRANYLTALKGNLSPADLCTQFQPTKESAKRDWNTRILKDALELLRDDVVSELLRTDPHLINKNTLLLAIRYGRGNIVMRLCASAYASRVAENPVNDLSIDKEVIQAAVQVPRPEILQQVCRYAPTQLLNDFRLDNGRSLIENAIAEGYYDLLVVLVNRGRESHVPTEDKLGVNYGQPGFKNVGKKTPLHWAVERSIKEQPVTPVTNIAWIQYGLEMVRLLLDPKNSRGTNKQAKVDIQDETGNTALHLACNGNAHKEVVELLAAAMPTDHRDQKWLLTNNQKQTVLKAYTEWQKRQKELEKAAKKTEGAAEQHTVESPPDAADSRTLSPPPVVASAEDPVNSPVLPKHRPKVWPWWLAAGALFLVAGLILAGGIAVLATHGGVLALVPFIAEPVFTTLVIALSSVAVGFGAVGLFGGGLCGWKGYQNKTAVITTQNKSDTTITPTADVPTLAAPPEAEDGFTKKSWLLCKPCRDETQPAVPPQQSAVLSS